jgi:hypothetical protein
MTHYHTQRDPSDRSSAGTSSTGQPKIACEACSTAKTGCDKAEPSCTRCKEKGIHCKTRFARRGGKPQAKPQAKPAAITTSASRPSAALDDSNAAEPRQNGLSASPAPLMTPTLSFSSSASGLPIRPSPADETRHSVKFGVMSNPDDLAAGESVSLTTGPPEVGLILTPTSISNQQYRGDFVWGAQFLTEDVEPGLDGVTMFGPATQDESSHADTAAAATLHETAATFTSPNNHSTPMTWDSPSSVTLGASATGSGGPYPTMQSLIGQFDNGGANVMLDGTASMVTGVTLAEIAPEVPNMSNTPMSMNRYSPPNDMPSHGSSHTPQLSSMGGWLRSPELPSVPHAQVEIGPHQLGGPQQQTPHELGDPEIWLDGPWPRNYQLHVVPGPSLTAAEMSKVINYLHQRACVVEVVSPDDSG